MPIPQASLQNTMTGEDVLSLMDAEEQRQAEELHQRTQAATAAQAQASQQYTDLAAQPSPQLAPSDVFIPTLLGNLASVIGGTPSYRENAQEGIKNSKAALLKQRADNLQALRDVYMQKADEAQKAGDLEATEKYRTKIETLSKTFDLVNSNAERSNRLELEKMRGEYGLKEAAIRAQNQKKDEAADTENYLDSLKVTTRDGEQFIDLTNLPNSANAKASVLAYAQRNKLPVADKNTAARLRTAEEVLSNLDTIEESMRQFLPADAKSRPTGAVKNLLQAWLQTNGDIASWGNTNLAAIRNIQALAAGEGSGFRLNQTEVNAAVRNFPKITDDLPAALRKIQWERNFLANKQRTFMKSDWRRTVGPETPKPNMTASAPSESVTMVRMTSPDGKKVRDVPQSSVKDAIAHGWKRVGR